MGCWRDYDLEWVELFEWEERGEITGEEENLALVVGRSALILLGSPVKDKTAVG